jgi:hypothetical protein
LGEQCAIESASEHSFALTFILLVSIVGGSVSATVAIAGEQLDHDRELTKELVRL